MVQLQLLYGQVSTNEQKGHFLTRPLTEMLRPIDNNLEGMIELLRSRDLPHP
jgi:hypothetical protein